MIPINQFNQSMRHEGMIHLHTWVLATCTLGLLTVWNSQGDRFDCFTVELPWRVNQPNRSCIAAGLYPYKKIISPSKKREVLRLEDVPGRDLINVENANYVSELRGCIAVGDKLEFLNSDPIPDAANAVQTLNRLLAFVPDAGFINITRVGHYI